MGYGLGHDVHSLNYKFIDNYQQVPSEGRDEGLQKSVIFKPVVKQIIYTTQIV